MLTHINPVALARWLIDRFYYEWSQVGCHKKMVRSVSIGLFIAFSPYLGLHNVLIFACAWCFNLSLPLTFIVAHLNNPWTMTPIYYADYVCGKWLLQQTGYRIMYANPWWMEHVNYYVRPIFGDSLCLWTFLIGGTILAIAIGAVSYFILKQAIKRAHS